MLQWQREYGGSNWLPSVRSTLALFAALAMVLLVVVGHGQLDQTVNAGKPSTLCQEHIGRPGWDAVCAKPAAGHRSP